MRAAAELALKAMACLGGDEPEASAAEVSLGMIESKLVPATLLPPDAAGIVARLRAGAAAPEAPAEAAALSLLSAGESLLQQAQQAAARTALS